MLFNHRWFGASAFLRNYTLKTTRFGKRQSLADGGYAMA
jgi:hypothetical protein